MIAYCRTCHEMTIVRPLVGARCSFCDETVVKPCASCGGPVYPKRQGRPSTRCKPCQTRQQRSAA